MQEKNRVEILSRQFSRMPLSRGYDSAPPPGTEVGEERLSVVFVDGPGPDPDWHLSMVCRFEKGHSNSTCAVSGHFFTVEERDKLKKALVGEF